MSRSIDRLTSLDLLMLGASKRWPQDIGALAILDGTMLLGPAGELRIDAVREAIASRLDLVPRFRQVIHAPGRGLGGPLWVDAPRFDIRDHVVVRPLPSGIDETGLLAVAEELRCQRFDPSRPLWRMWFMPGLPNGRVAMFVKLHHSIADGMAAMSTIAAFLDAGPDVPITPASPWTPTPPPSDRELFIDNAQRRLGAVRRAGSMLVRPGATLRHARQAWPATRELLAEEPATRTSLDRMVGPGRSLAVIRNSLDEIKTVAHAHGATVNDVLLALTAGGLRAVLRRRGEPVEGTKVRAYVPVSLRSRIGGPQQGNVIAQMAVPLAMREPDAGNELRRIAAETATRKMRARTSLGTLIRGRLVRRLMLFAVMRQRVNVTTASIPGPAVPLYLTGARVLEVFPVLPLIANEPLGVGALSYAGAFNIGVVADRDAYPDLDVFVAGAREELGMLGVSTSSAATVGDRGHDDAITPNVHISLMLAVQDAPAAVDWYKRALGATELWNLGGVAGLSIAGAPVFVGEPENNGWDAPAVAGTRTVRVEVFTDDPDGFIERAVAAGADGSIDQIRGHQAPWGIHRQGGFIDPFGHLWLVGDKSPLQRFPG